MLPTTDKERKALPIFTFLTKYFPDAVIALVNVSVRGNIQHNPELAPADIKWARGKSTDQLNTAMRHMWDHGTGTTRDSDGQYHLAKAAWRILAQLQLTIESEQCYDGDVPDREACDPQPGPYDKLFAEDDFARRPQPGVPFESVSGPIKERHTVIGDFTGKLGDTVPCCSHGRLICAVCKFP
jgi:hypothetical protein